MDYSVLEKSVLFSGVPTKELRDVLETVIGFIPVVELCPRSNLLQSNSIETAKEIYPVGFLGRLLLGSQTNVNHTVQTGDTVRTAVNGRLSHQIKVLVKDLDFTYSGRRIGKRSLGL